MNRSSSSSCGPVGCSFAAERISALESRMRFYAQIRTATLASTAALEPQIIKEDVVVLSRKMAEAEAKMTVLRACVKSN